MRPIRREQGVTEDQNFARGLPSIEVWYEMVVTSKVGKG